MSVYQTTCTDPVIGQVSDILKTNNVAFQYPGKTNGGQTVLKERIIDRFMPLEFSKSEDKTELQTKLLEFLKSTCEYICVGK